jgi:uncharacterized protein (TIGR01244 family)
MHRFRAPFRSALLAAATLGVAAAATAQGTVTRESVPGIISFAQVQTTVACGGRINPAAIAELKQRGFKSVFDLQLPDEAGADVAGEESSAGTAGMKFYSVPFTPSKPDTSVVERFVRLIADPENTPAFIHCAGGNRAAGFWMIKRVLVDNWDLDRAVAEAEALGLQQGAMRTFALDYVRTHK